MAWLLDTNVLIAISKRHPSVVDRLQRCRQEDLLLSSVVLAEIEYGIAKSARPAFNRRVFESIMRNFETVGFNANEARHYGELRAELDRQGLPIGPNDLMIAAQALACGAILVTDNTREFSRVGGLVLENWLEPAPR